MSDNLPLARAHALSLAYTLMVCITLFHSAAGYGVIESADYDGDTGSIVHVYDPFDL